MVRTFTNSELQTYANCSMQHHYAYELLRRPIGSRPFAFEFGTAVHAALETWWLTQDADASLERLNVLDGLEMYRARAMMRGYFSTYLTRWRWSNVEVEREFRVQIMKDTFLAGKFDALATDEDGRVWVIEHKTTGDRFDGPYIQALPLDAQVGRYMIAAKFMGLEPAGVIYDVLKKPTHSFTAKDIDETRWEQRVLQALVSGDYYRQVRLTYSDEHLDAILKATRDTIKNIQFNDPVMALGRACKSYGSVCEYMDVCILQKEIGNDLLFKTKERKHEELSQ